MRKYEGNKDSGIEWIGQIPKHWNLMKLKYVAKVQVSGVDKKTNDNEVPIRLCNYIDVYKNSFITSDLNFMEASATEAEIQKFSLRNDDVIVTKDSEDPNDIGVPALVNGDLTDVICAYHLAQIKTNKQKLLGSFLFYLFSTNTLRQYFSTEALGVTRYGLATEVLNDLVIPIPLDGEQLKIAEVLNAKCLDIDNCILKKVELVDLLKEEKEAIINHTVIKGIDDAAPMKSSGIEWLGDIPAHWEVKRLKRLTTMITNGYVGPTRDILREQGVKYIQSLHIKENTIKFHTPYFVSEEWSNAHSRSILKENDILVVQTGAGTGNIGIVPKDFAGCNCHALIILRINESLSHAPYILNVFLSNYGFHKLKSIETGALHPHLNSTIICDVELPVPPIEEQHKIMSFINDEVKKIDSAVSKIKKEIELLTEYKTSLIYEVVTGKVRVDTLVEQPLEAML